MSISPDKRVRAKTIQRVAILLQDQDAIGRVYVELEGGLKSREVMVEALKRLEDGLIYADENCKEVINSEYIELSRKKGTGRRDEEEFIFLIDREYAEDYVVSAKIIK
ncbi:hypothetical protein ACFPES_28810 [Paenibacillus sp. GCM10023248]|uniref:hypothetical protein n=1 Tax=Bacillales TaxID=1385 RepID=UPI0023798DC0|nr:MULTISPECIES: hypothetical protein [Bacillales]MDD9271055.1 hypothetical protein [Paenibacillus sp. MAHUQ-63]MDR6882807.1 hypothetical protein [Bacillus sp. 3255]